MRSLLFALLLVLTGFCFGCGAGSSYKSREADEIGSDDAHEYDLEGPDAAPEK